MIGAGCAMEEFQEQAGTGPAQQSQAGTAGAPGAWGAHGEHAARKAKWSRTVVNPSVFHPSSTPLAE